MKNSLVSCFLTHGVDEIAASCHVVRTETTVWHCRVLSGVVELHPPRVTMATSCTDKSPSRRHIDVIPASTCSPAAAPNNDDANDEEEDGFDENVVTSRRAPASYLRHARMSICRMTSDYIRRLPSGRTRKDRSATRRERKATKTLAIVLGQLSASRCRINLNPFLP